MDAVPPRQLARTGEPLAWRQVIAQNAEHHLRHQLLPHGNLTAARKPELHGDTSVRQAPSKTTSKQKGCEDRAHPDHRSPITDH
jgi:hypothetical protein